MLTKWHYMNCSRQHIQCIYRSHITNSDLTLKNTWWTPDGLVSQQAEYVAITTVSGLGYPGYCSSNEVLCSMSPSGLKNDDICRVSYMGTSNI